MRNSGFRSGIGRLALLGCLCIVAAEARTRPGEKLMEQARAAESSGDLEGALKLARQALETDLQDAAYRILVYRLRGQVERQKTSKTASTAAAQQVKSPSEEYAAPPRLAPTVERLARVYIANQSPRVIFETIGKLGGINVIMDPNYPASAKNFTFDASGRTVEQALDDAALLTKSFWKPISKNTVFIAPDNASARRDYEEQAVKVVYLRNALGQQDMNELVTSIRALVDLRRMFLYTGQGAVIVRGTVDQVLLAEKLIHEVDQPRSEAMIDILVLEVSRARSREITSALTGSSGYGLSVPVSFTPRSGTTTSSTSSSSSTTTKTTLASLGKISSADFSTTLPGGLVNLIASDRETRILQNPQLRSLDGQKATLKVGQKVPFAAGSYNTGTLATSGTSVASVVSTSFQYADVGVNVDMIPKVHSSTELSLHIEVEVSSVADRVDIGGITQPVIGQRKVMHDIRMHDGEAVLLAGLSQDQQTGTKSGVPKLLDIPFLRNFFSSNTTERDRSDLMIVLVPHVVRAGAGALGDSALISVGTEGTVKLNTTENPAPSGNR